jgi:hypothetical protein
MPDTALAVIQPANGRSCRTCGFLAVSQYAGGDTANTRVYDASEEARSKGNLFQVAVGDGQRYAKPVCLRGVCQFLQKMGITDLTNPGNRTKAEAFLAAPMDCPEWFELVPGLSPDQHLEAYRMLKLEEMRRDWEERQERQHREWVDAKDTERAKQDARRDRDQRRNNRITILIAVVAAFFGLGQFLTSVPSFYDWAEKKWRGTVNAPPLPSTPSSPDASPQSSASLAGGMGITS